MAPGHPGGTQEAPRRHPGGTQEHPGGSLWRSLDVSGDPWDHLGHLSASISKRLIVDCVL